MTAREVMAALAKHGSPEDAVFLQRFFKTGKGQYGEGDQFIGVRLPDTRAVCQQFHDLPLAEIQQLFNSPVHEHRLAAALILAYRYPKAISKEQEKVFRLYLKNVRAGRINNWDLIDTTAEHVVGAHEEHTDRTLLFELARSGDLWSKRAGIMSAFRYIKHGDPSTSLKLCAVLVNDTHDLIQKAVGWQLREIGKRGHPELLVAFLDRHATTMPRTALRYALEHLAPQQKAHYMALKTTA